VREGWKQLYTTPPAAPVQPVAHIVGEIDHTGKVWKPVQPAFVPITPAEVHGMAEAHGIDGDARHWYVVGITDSEKHHGITKGQS
jgi:hypothetical protein